MCPVVLDGKNGEAGFLCGLCGKILGVEVRYNLARQDTEELLQARCLTVESQEGFFGLQVADMLADEDIAAAAHGHRVLEVRPYGKKFGKIVTDAHRQRSISPGAAHHQLASEHDANQRIVHVTVNRPVVYEEDVGNFPEPGYRVILIRADGLVGDVSTGCDNRETKLAEQNMM
jgi:hypothetical protein